jgi:hypothetical protein
MTWRLLILSAAVAFATAQAPAAFAKPPEDEIAERAERATERAAKAADRASDAAERASERAERDRVDHKSFGNERSDRKNSDGKRSERVAEEETGKSGDGSRSPVDGDGDKQSFSVSGSSGGQDDPVVLAKSGDGSENEQGDNSGSGSNSGPGSSDDNDDDDHSGSSHDDDDDDDDDKRDQRAVIVPLENDDGGNPFREGELVVMSDDNALLGRAEALGFSVIEARPLESLGAVVARLRRPEGVSSNEALAMLRTREPGSPSGYNYIYRATGTASDAPDEDQRDPQLEPLKPARAGAKVGVIDGFSGDSVAGWSVERLVAKPAKAGHGDVVTGILLRDLDTAYRLSPEKLMLLDVMREHPGGGAADVSALVFAFDRLVTAGMDVANLSLAGPDHPALRMAVSKSIQRGLIVVAAVGNGGPAAPPAFPSAYDGVVGVAAVDATSKPYIYSGRGPHVDIAALGEEVDASGTGGALVGTSYAAPHVTALLASISIGRKPSSVDTLLTAYAEDAGSPGRDPVYGVGILAPDKPERLALASGASASN